jgi:hypothetical protein
MSQVLWKWALEDAASDDQAPGHGLEGDHLKEGGRPFISASVSVPSVHGTASPDDPRAWHGRKA